MLLIITFSLFILDGCIENSNILQIKCANEGQFGESDHEWDIVRQIVNS